MVENNAVILGCLISISFATIYVLFGSNICSNKINQKKKNKDIQINGLVNYNNNCFLNVIVQSLCSSQSFIEWLKESLIEQKKYKLNSSEKFIKINKINYITSIIIKNHLLNKLVKYLNLKKIKNKFDIQQTLTYNLLNLLQETNFKDKKTNSNASILLELLCEDIFNENNEQQDAHELFNLITSTLENEILKTLQHNFLNKIFLNLENSIEDEDFCKQINLDKFSNRLNFEYNLIKFLNLKRKLPTKGLLASQLYCVTCNYKFTVNFDIFHCISLAIPNKKKNSSITLKDCLDSFVSNEFINNVLCENCKKLNKTGKFKSTFKKRLTFAKLPKLLVIHIKRLVVLPNGMPVKRNDHIEFPETLIMDDYLYENFAIPTENSNNSINIDQKKSKILTSYEYKLNKNDEQQFKIKNLESISKEKQNDQTNLKDKMNILSNLSNETIGDYINNFNLENRIENKITNKYTFTNTSKEISFVNDTENFTNSTHMTNCINSIVERKDKFEFTNSTEPQKSFSKNSSKETLFNSIKSKSDFLSLSKKSKKYKYRLNATIVHLGNAFTGHYVNYRKLTNIDSIKNLNNNIDEDDWYYTSDTIVEETNIENVLNSKAYMLFYERINN